MNFEMDGIDEVLHMLDSIDANEIAKKALDAASPLTQEALQRCIRGVTTKKYSTGALARSVKANKAKINQYGVFAAVVVKGSDEKGMRNAEKLAYLEYGVSGRQAAKPVLAKAVAMVEEECTQIIERVVGEEIDKL